MKSIAGFIDFKNRTYSYTGDSNCLTELTDSLILYRDLAGLMPIFYTIVQTRLLFASDIPTLLAYPGVEVQLDAVGLAELLALGPARYEYSGVLKGIHALPPGCRLSVKESGEVVVERYWDFVDKTIADSEEEIIQNVRTMLTKATLARLDDNSVSLLSGGVDSSIVTAIAADYYREAGKQLTTFSFDFKDSARHFKSNSFQPDRDRPWVDKMVEHCQTRHEYLECSPEDLIDSLYPAVEARGLPGMADVDASLLYFCGKIPQGTILTGEGADEIFCGYPWFHNDSTVEIFPWSRDFATRTALLKDEVAVGLEDVAKIHCKAYTDKFDDRDRKLGYLTLKWFMPTLLDRMYSMAKGFNIAAPFADVKLMEYVWSIPWDIKCKNGVVKHVLREAGRGLNVPDEVLFRKKSPFPKTYDPRYTALLAERLYDVIVDPTAPVRDIIDTKKTRKFIEDMLKDPNTSKPWFGQLMAGPQMMAYVLQLDYWLRRYKVRLL